MNTNIENRQQDIFDKLFDLPFLKWAQPFYSKNKEVLMYLLFGGLTTVVSILSFWLLTSGTGLNELIANVISWILAVLFAYVTNRTWVFQSKASGGKEIFREIISFFGGRLATLGMEELILFVFVTKLGWNSMAVKIVAQVVVIVANYVISKLFVFKKEN